MSEKCQLLLTELHRMAFSVWVNHARLLTLKYPFRCKIDIHVAKTMLTEMERKIIDDPICLHRLGYFKKPDVRDFNWDSSADKDHLERYCGQIMSMHGSRETSP